VIGAAIILCSVLAPLSSSAREVDTGSPTAEPASDRVVAAARAIMAAARYCSLVTLGADGQPQVRTMDPFPPEDDMTVWFGTLRRSRKVGQIREDSRVALHYLAPEGVGYVTIEGTARIVDDPAEKARRWKEEWEEFYPDREADYLLIAVTPKTLRVLDLSRGVVADPETWKVPTVEFTSDPARP